VLGPRAADLGAIEHGKRANLLVLDRDPSVDITATRDIAQIWRTDSLLARRRASVPAGRRAEVGKHRSGH